MPSLPCSCAQFRCFPLYLRVLAVCFHWRWPMYSSSFFFFQAEDGIRDYKVTGVQTCALPIFLHLTIRDDVLRFALCAAALGTVRGAHVLPLHRSISFHFSLLTSSRRTRRPRS